MAMAGRRLVVFMSTVSPKLLCTATEAAKTVTEDKVGNLYRRLRALNGSEGAKIAETMDEWVKERNNLSRFDIIGSVRLLRRDKKFSQAIQVHEWMEKSNYEMNEVDHAIHIDLLAKRKGVVPAEEYFNSLQGSSKSKKTYGALLSAYCRDEEMLEKALELFEKIKALGFESSLGYSNLMGLYLLVGQPEKVPLLAQEMEEQNIAADWFIYTKLINSFISLKNFDGVEGVLKKMDLNKVKCDWFTYKKIATFYVNTGNLEKANAALNKLETMEKLHYYNHFHTLITLYAQASDLSGVKRTWESLKLTFPKPNNTSYVVMLLALSKLGDVDTLEKCFREWESDCINYDFRVSNVVLKSYLERDMIEEAKLVYEGMLKKGAKPNLRTFELLANYHIRKQHVDLAMKYVEMAPSIAIPEKPSWFPSEETVRMFVRYFEENYDAEKAEKFSNIMKKIGHLDSTLHDSLLRVNITAG